MNLTDVFVYDTKNHNYPKHAPFNPSVGYPEYKYKNNISNLDNPVYEGVRNLFKLANLDSINYDTCSWNPLGEFIKPNMTVLLKPNIVMHYNPESGETTDCLITNASVIRPIIDYVLIALKGSGKIIIGDAPMLKCNFNEAIIASGLKDVLKYYKENNIEIELIDFRNEYAVTDQKGRIKRVVKQKGDPRGYSVVQMGSKSAFCTDNIPHNLLRITSYRPEEMIKHHDNNNHEYLIPNSVLASDVVINLPKPKTHKKAGLTGALKNVVGIAGSKEWLPHHKKGSVAEGGDEYLHQDLFSTWNTQFQEKIDISSINGKVATKWTYIFLKKINGFFKKRLSTNSYSEGSWWGNDTIWRTIYDLNRIFEYANKMGTLVCEKQRVVLSIGDMIVSGDGEGPLSPKAKYAGLLLMSNSSVNFDIVLACLMGFDFEKIPSIFKIKNNSTSTEMNGADDIQIQSNNEIYLKQIQEFTKEESLKFNPTKGWKNHIEK